MNASLFQITPPQLLQRDDSSQLFHVLQQEGSQIIGPVIPHGTVQWKGITTPKELLIGWKDQQEHGNYRLEPDSSPRYFNIVHGPESLKPLTFTPRETLLVLECHDRTFSPKGLLNNDDINGHI